MRKDFKRQLVLSVILILTSNILNTVLKHWIFTSIGFCLVGLLYIIRPLKMNDNKPEKRQLFECRVAGVILY